MSTSEQLAVEVTQHPVMQKCRQDAEYDDEATIKELTIKLRQKCNADLLGKFIELAFERMGEVASKMSSPPIEGK